MMDLSPWKSIYTLQALVDRAQTPERILDAHGKGPFHGENCMHVLCVQQREEALCEAFDVAARGLRLRLVGSLLVRHDLERLDPAHALAAFITNDSAPGETAVPRARHQHAGGRCSWRGLGEREAA